MKQLPSLRISSFNLLGHKLLCDFSNGAPRPLLPPIFHYPAFATAHTLSHPGIRASKRLMSTRWVWVGMAADIARWCCDCQHCQRAKVTKQLRGQQPSTSPSLPGDSHMFILTWWGPFPALPTVSTTSSLWCTLIQVVGGRTAVPHRHGNHSSRLHFKLDCPLWRAGSSHLRPGPSVLFSSLVRIVTAVGHQTPPHYCLPPSSQQDGRESTPPTQGCLADPRRQLAATGLLTSSGFYSECGWLPKRTPNYLQRS